MISKTSRKLLSSLISICLAVLCSGLAAHADSLPPELIPPDVTLTPHTGSTPTTPPADSATPGIGGPKSATSASTTGVQQPPPPPAGSSKYSGFGSSPPGTPGGHKGMPVYPPGQQPSEPPPAPAGPDPVAVIETNRGTIAIRLFRQYAPKTVEAFTEMVNSGFYNGLLWHRVEPGFVIQGGCPNGNGSGLYIDPKTNQPRMLMLESSPMVKHNMPGVVAMARFPKNPNSASCQFYITLGPQPNLDFKYTIFGGVISGLDVVSRIQKGDKMESIRVQPQ